MKRLSIILGTALLMAATIFVISDSADAGEPPIETMRLSPSILLPWTVQASQEAG